MADPGRRPASRESHAAVTAGIAGFRDAQERIEHAAARAGADGTAAELADELSVGRRALALDLDSALKENR